MISKNLNINEIGDILAENNYISDETIATIVFLAIELKKPILIEGPPGTGKTQLSKSIAKAFEKDFFRIQCYEGITFEQIVGEWNYQKQLLSLEMSKLNKNEDNVFKEDFFIKRPLLSAFMNNKSSVILIDEIDKADEEVESFLLQALGEKQITVNDLGTFELMNDLLVIMTSNSQRQLLDETKDRCLYLYIDYPSFQREVEIVRSHIPTASEKLVKSVVKAVQQIRNLNVTKNPSIRASVDWVKSLIVFNKEELDKDSFEKTLSIAIKNEDDRQKVLENIKLK
ncbi:MoxR family ATPase [Methanobrevibacter sp. TMH8]|uniref:AAA family ATPase n=1 Tax=Methanobrevibacter sp. TMH8 TaxID=2848611 RepID=UPI001CCCAF39|nr:MoxR family ATPase [Methanobrevibacter sp. TMH8]MBZ9571699.1 MoxR family ATPase [Methanobrevibacter sp. TMH8]